ncbi:hypothetical protein L7F22_042179 [Adiantum nelumboides]|nr:hypothetical protein [Adiantum nelumboides]
MSALRNDDNDENNETNDEVNETITPIITQFPTHERFIDRRMEVRQFLEALHATFYEQRQSRPKTPKLKVYDDQRFQDDLQQTGQGNGVRVWYESYTTIDWIHDAVKESSRLRRLRSIKGYRGIFLNLWDRFQGWLIVTVTGIITALIAGGIVKSEAVLFDLKEGYCQRDWRLAKRFCCPFGDQPDWDGGGSNGFASNISRLNATSSPAWSYRSKFMTLSSGSSDPTKGLLTGMRNRMLAGWSAPVASSPFWRTLSANPENENCPGWVTWADKFHLHGKWNFVAEYGVYILVAILWASIASLLTVYLTSSELYVKNKTTEEEVQATTNTHSHSPVIPSQPLMADENTPLLSSIRAGDDSMDRTYNSNMPPNISNKNALPTKIFSHLASEVRAREALPPRKVLYFGSGSGPFVHIASCVGNIVCRVFPKYETNESKRREILSCACAAGVAVAFGAPVGGVLFSLEEVSYYFSSKVMFRSFFCATVAAATLRFLDPFGTGKIVLFEVTYDRDWHWIELVFFIVLGIFGGIYGALFTKLNMIWSKRVRAKSWMATHPLYEVIMITIISVAASFLNDYTRMGGPELIADLFSECHEHESLEGLCVSTPSQIGPLVTSVAWAMVLKGALTIITFGIKLPAGIFIPTLCVGACFGRIVGLLVQYIQWTRPNLAFFAWCQADKSTACIVPGVYAMVGAAACLSGVTRTTISLVVIMFELTGTLTYAVPVILSVLVARTIADGLEHKGIYDLVMEFSGLPYLDAKEEHTWHGVSIVDAVDTGIEVISLDEQNTVQSLKEKLERLAIVTSNPDGGFPIVVDSTRRVGRTGMSGFGNGGGESGLSKRKLVGYIAAQELEHGLNRLIEYDDGKTPPSNLFCTFDFLPRPDRVVEPALHSSLPTPMERSESIDGTESIGSPSIMGTDYFMRDSVLLASMDSPKDLSIFVDKAPITLTTSSPLELVQQMFTKLGVRYLIVLHATDGTLKGVIFKKRWLAFLHSLEEGEKHI